jgi:hypothetical protein
MNNPIWRDTNRLLLEVEQAVKCFPRYHKYTLETELRRNAMLICLKLIAIIFRLNQINYFQRQYSKESRSI